jgi:hypothetical protein
MKFVSEVKQTKRSKEAGSKKQIEEEGEVHAWTTTSSQDISRSISLAKGPFLLLASGFLLLIET